MSISGHCPLLERQRDLARLWNKSRKAVPCLFLVESFPEGTPLLERSGNYGTHAAFALRLRARLSDLVIFEATSTFTVITARSPQGRPCR